MSDGTEIVSPVPGVVVKVLVAKGDKVDNGQPVAVIQSMKTEIPIVAEANGRVDEVFVKEGDEVDIGAALVRVI